jgi:hypothetical protein
MNDIAATRVASQRAVATCNLYLSNSPIIHITKDAQATAAFTRIFPECVKDKMTMSKPRSANSSLQSESGVTLQSRQKICHNQVRDDFASIARGGSVGVVVFHITVLGSRWDFFQISRPRSGKIFQTRCIPDQICHQIWKILQHTFGRFLGTVDMADDVRKRSR